MIEKSDDDDVTVMQEKGKKWNYNKFTTKKICASCLPTPFFDEQLNKKVLNNQSLFLLSTSERVKRDGLGIYRSKDSFRKRK